jgi:sphinganine-1-phosphate aldolase
MSVSNEHLAPQHDLGLAREGMSADQVMAALGGFKAANPGVMKTLMSLGVNYCGKDVQDIATQAHTLFAHDNNHWVEACPGSLQIETDVLQVSARLLSGGRPGVVATMSSGGTESIFNAVHAAREHARRLRPEVTRPRWIASYNTHPAITKSCHYLGIELVRVPDRDCRADVGAIAREIDEQTIGLYASAPCFPFGLYDDVPALGRLALENDLWLHCDACIGGFLAPFIQRLGHLVPPWDFSVPGVMSISADIHKFGYGLKPASVVAWREPALLQDHFVVVDEWPPGRYESAGFTGSRPTGPVAAAWAVMHLLGEDGYLDRAREIMRLREELLRGLAAIDGIELPTPAPELNIVTYAGRDVGTDRILKGMLEYGWMHFSDVDPPLVMFLIDPSAGEIMDAYLADLALVVERARGGAFADDESLKTY